MKKPSPRNRLAILADEVIDCSLCPRLATYRSSIHGKEESYWNRPVPGFGDPRARLLVIGLAPGAHGANRTGRPFTGDFAGVWLYRALHEMGLSSRMESTAVDDGLKLRKTWITNVIRCVPPANKPRSDEVHNCAPFLARELEALEGRQVVLALGRLAHDAFVRFARSTTAPEIRMKDHPFTHGARHELSRDLPVLFDSYHTSRYNVSTKVLKWDMFMSVVREATREAGL